MPTPEAVNEVFWTGFAFICREPTKRIAIHCTHGYNRTGACAIVLRMPVGARARDVAAHLLAKLPHCSAAYHCRHIRSISE